MIKKIILTILLLSQIAVYASFNDVLISNVTYDWINKTEVEREAIIQEVKDIIFEQPVEKQKDFRSQFKEKFKISPAHDIIGEHKWKLNLWQFQ